jgi:hypothetical protein
MNTRKIFGEMFLETFPQTSVEEINFQYDEFLNVSDIYPEMFEEELYEEIRNFIYALTLEGIFDDGADLFPY